MHTQQLHGMRVLGVTSLVLDVGRACVVSAACVGDLLDLTWHCVGSSVWLASHCGHV